MYLECFPVDIGDIQLVWETSESATILPVAFSYKKFIYEPADTTKYLVKT